MDQILVLVNLTLRTPSNKPSIIVWIGLIAFSTVSEMILRCSMNEIDRYGWRHCILSRHSKKGEPLFSAIIQVFTKKGLSLTFLHLHWLYGSVIMGAGCIGCKEKNRAEDVWLRSLHGFGKTGNSIMERNNPFWTIDIAKLFFAYVLWSPIRNFFHIYRKHLAQLLMEL